jgi:hypothetical protein
MVFKYKATQPSVIHTETITKDGECKVLINIQLDINVNNGAVSIKTAPSTEKDEEKVDWAIPDFSQSPKLKFGKEEK